MTSSQAATIAIAPEYWRRQGVPDSDASVSFAYLQKAVAGFSSAASRSPSAEVNHGYLRPARVVEDAEGFDCRSSERPRKKRAQSTPQVELPAKKAEDAKQEKQQEQPPPPLQQATEPEREASAQNVKPEAQLIEQATRKPTPPETSGEKRRQSRATSEKKQATQSTPVQVQATPLIAASKAARQASKPVQIAEPTPKVTHIYSPPNLPPGWECRMRHQSERGNKKRHDATYFAPWGTRFPSLRKVQEYCVLTGIPLPSPSATPAEAQKASAEDEVISMRAVRQLLGAAARDACLPVEGGIIKVAALKARIKLRLEGSDKAELA